MWLLPIFLAIISSTRAAVVPYTEFKNGMQTFASDFYDEAVRPESKNVIVSPYSVASALAFLSQGASGSTFEQIKNALHVTSGKTDIAENYFEYDNALEQDVGKAIFSTTNEIFVKQNAALNKNFQETAKKHFLSGVQTVDFSKPTEAAAKINHFVAEKTHDKIKDLISPDSLKENSSVVLVNAIHMKAKWEHAFMPAGTYKQDFYSNEVEKASVDFMHATQEFNHAVFNDLHFAVLEMKYAESDMSMLILLPDSRTGLSTLDTQMHGLDLDGIVDQLKPKRVRVAMPKFKIQHKVELNDVLIRMGMSDMFDEDKANLSGLLEGDEQLSISKAIHQAFIEVDEEGAEAAAATALLIETNRSMFVRFDAESFVADHPFVYHIWDRKLKMSIFSGHITQLQ